MTASTAAWPDIAWEGGKDECSAKEENDEPEEEDNGVRENTMKRRKIFLIWMMDLQI